MNDLNYYENYYKKNDYKLSKKQKKRIYNTISLIPDDVDSILEVGCGDGRIINPLVNKYKNVCGLDISQESLKNVKTLKVVGSIEDLPFEDDNFDIVLCCEVLEHLPVEIYEKSLKEIERVAKKYILLSVPNNENLDILKISCPYCKCSFHPYRHLRSYDLDKLKKIFENFEVCKSEVVFTNEKRYPPSFIKIARFLKLTKPYFPEMALCPQCGYSNQNKLIKKMKVKKNSKTIEKFSEKFFNPLLSKKSGGWILSLYKNKDY